MIILCIYTFCVIVSHASATKIWGWGRGVRLSFFFFLRKTKSGHPYSGNRKDCLVADANRLSISSRLTYLVLH